MAKVSRRAIIAAGIALPAASAAKAASPLQGSQKAPTDPLVPRAEEWIALRERVDALSVEADHLEGMVFDKARALGLNRDRASRSSLPEARVWRAKRREFDEGGQSLERLARDIRGMRAITVAGAIAKIELSLHIQYEEWSEHAFEFLQDGIAELRELTAKTVESC